jgi:hypothetical protein
MGQKPDCVLCPNKGGAMKSTRSGQKWAHVSCALWIPEVSIGSVDRMEPITKISSIPQSRWALVCVLCRERVGACIQCSVKTCKTAYHVTCAFQHGLEMRAIIEDENAEDGVKLRSYCQKHSVKKGKGKEPKNSANSEKLTSASEDDENNTIPKTTTTTTSSHMVASTTNKKKIRKEMTSEERSHARRARLVEIQSEFAKHVSVKDISCHLLDVDQEGINTIYNYWILKRKSVGNEPLLPPKAGDVDVLSQTDQEQADLEKMKMFVHLRQDLERVRNLCYMVSRREKLSRSFFKMREQIFHKQVSILGSQKKTNKLDDDVLKAIMEANHGPSIYDVLYSHDDVVKDSRVMRIDEMIDSILGNKSNASPNKTLLETNGNVKREKMDAISRYSKLFNGNAINTVGSNKKYSSYESLSSDTDGMGTRRSRRKLSHRMASSSSIASTSEDEGLSPTRPTSKKSGTSMSPSKAKSITSPAVSAITTPTRGTTTAVGSQPKKKGRPLGSTKQAVAEKRRQLNVLSSKEKLNNSFGLDTTTDDEENKISSQPTPKTKSSTRNRLATDDLTDESDELVPIKNSSGHSIPTTQGGTIKKMHSSAIYSDSDDSSSSTDKDNRTDHTVSDSQLQPFRTKAAMKEFNVNELLLFTAAQKSNDELKQNVMPNSSNRKNHSVQSSNTTQSKRHSSNVSTPTARSPSIKKEGKTSSIKALKSTTKSKSSIKSSANNILSSGSDDEEVSPVKKCNASSKKDVLVDLLVVPQREAAKKASENLMKTNSSSLIQSITSTATEKSKREAKEKLDETIAAAKAAVDSVEREKQREVKAKITSNKTSVVPPTVLPSSKEKSKNDKKSQKDEKSISTIVEKEIPKKIEKNIFTDPVDTDFLPYVPQRQAAKKAAEHIKGINSNTSQQHQNAPTAQPPSLVEEKPAKVPPTTEKSSSDRRKSIAVESASSSSSSSSNSGSDSSKSDSDSEGVSTRKTNIKGQPSKIISKTSPANRRTSVSAAGSKQKAKELLFLDKSSKSSAHAKSSSSASSDESDASSDRPSSSRLHQKGNKSKRKPTDKQREQPQESPSDKKGSTESASHKKSSKSSPVKKENDKPSRRMSIITTKAPTIDAAPAKAANSSRSPQKPSVESTKSTESGSLSSRKRSTSTATPTPVATIPPLSSPLTSPTASSPTKVSNNNKSRSTESNKRDLARSADKRKVSDDVSETTQSSAAAVIPSKMVDEKPEKVDKRRKSSVAEKPKESEVLSSKEVSAEKEKAQQVPKNVEKIQDIASPKVDTKNVVAQEKKIEVDVKMDIDDSCTASKPVNETPKTNIPAASPMISIPTINLGTNILQNKSLSFSNSEASNKFDITNKVMSSEDQERETYSLIEKLRQKNKKNANASNDSHDTTVDQKFSYLRQNENIPDQELQRAPSKINSPFMASPSSLRKETTELNDLKKPPFMQQNQLQHPDMQQVQFNEINLNYQRNVLKSPSCNKMNLLNEPNSSPASCMVMEQQQKQQALMNQKALMDVDNSRSPSVMHMPMKGMTMNEQIHGNNNPSMEQNFNMLRQQTKCPLDPKSINLQQPTIPREILEDDLINRRTDTSGMENMMNSMNQPAAMKNFHNHKSPILNDFTNSFHHPHMQSNAPNFNAYNFTDPTQYPGPVSLFPSDINQVQVPFPSPGQAMFPPHFGNQNPSCTISQQNNDHTLMFHAGVSSANKKNTGNEMLNLHNQTDSMMPLAQQQQQQSQQMKHVNEVSKSPSKSTRSSPRNMTPTYVGGSKTPQKSPSKSPRQPPLSIPQTAYQEAAFSRQNSLKGKAIPNAVTDSGKKRKSRTNSQASPATTPTDQRASNKGRPRNNNNKGTKGRFAANQMPFIPFNNEHEYITMDKKLVGTVYDFSADEEFATNPSVENLRTMRDRRKSIDFHNKMNRDGSSQSPKFTKSSMKPLTPLTHPLAVNNHTMPNTVVNESESIGNATGSITTNMNLVNMPGPVDMRTYNSFDNTNDSYNSQLLGAFATNTVDLSLDEINEEQEKELQTALKASNDKQKTPSSSAVTATTAISESKSSSAEITNIVEESIDSEASFAKVSLSDSRNQLKLKIKGPLAYHHDVQSQSVNSSQILPIASNVGGGNAASSNRRQMRKKELLQQYWNQDMNMEPSTAVSNEQASANVSLNRVGGIPKAVDSMRPEFIKDEFDLNIYAEYKKRKRFPYNKAGIDPHAVDVEMGGGLNADATNVINDSDPLMMDVNSKKRRNQRNRAAQLQANASGFAPPPKLKIKIGTDIMESSGSDLPPKKRLIAQPPSYQDLKRESMNFRKQMMDSFSEEKESRAKLDKEKRKEKKKKKKEKKRQSVEIVSQQISEGAPVKLILKISSKLPNATAATENVDKVPVAEESEQKKTPSPPSLKIKISRNSQGNGEYNILNCNQKKNQQSALDTKISNNNNNVQDIINESTTDNSAILGKTLEVALERIENVDKAKAELTNKVAEQKEICQVR